MLIEVLISSHFEEMKIWGDLCQSLAWFKLCLDPVELLHFLWIGKRLLLSPLVLLNHLHTLLYFFCIRLVVSLFLVSETSHQLDVSLSPRLIRLDRLHNLIGRSRWLVNRTPNRLRLVHEGVSRRHLHAADEVLIWNAVPVFVCQLEDWVGKALLGRLISLQLGNVRTILHERFQHVWAPSNEVHIGRKLRLPFV